VQPAASAGAIFQVDSMKGVFQGVITPTGPMGRRVVTFQCVGVGRLLPVARGRRKVGEETEVLGPAQRRLRHEAPGLPGIPAFAEGDLFGPRLDPVGDAVQDRLALVAVHRRPGRKGRRRRLAAASTVCASPNATRAIRLSSTGERVSNH
jgi:hypothetical protein